MKIEDSVGYVLEDAHGLAEAWRLSWTGQLERALAAANQLLADATRRGAEQARAGCSLLIGECCLHLGRIDEALDYARAAAEIYTHLGNTPCQARARALHAWILVTKAESELALDEALAALRLAMATSDATAQAFALDVTGMVYWLIQQPAKALTFFEDAINIARRTGNDVQLGAGHRNLPAGWRCLVLADRAVQHRRAFLPVE
jgi:tetratricopeptide (TPR) repeat protein